MSEMTEVSEIHSLHSSLIIEDNSLSCYDALSGFDYNLFIHTFIPN